MATETTTHSWPPTLVAGGIIVALGALSNVATIATPVPLPVIMTGVVLAAAATAALVGIWMQKGWGRALGVITLGGTILIAAPGIAFAPSQEIARLAIVTVGMAAVGVMLLVLPASKVGHPVP